MLRERPDTFLCDACHRSQRLDAACWPTWQRPGPLRCVGCCHCAVHDGFDDPGGVAVFSGVPLTWRGLRP